MNAYERALLWRKLSDEDRQLIEVDEILYGHSYVVVWADGTADRLDPSDIDLCDALIETG